MTDLAQSAVIALAILVTTAAAIIVPQAAVQRSVVRHLGDEISDEQKTEELRQIMNALNQIQDRADAVEAKVEDKK